MAAEIDLRLIELIAIISVPVVGIIVTMFFNIRAQNATTGAQFVTLMNNLAQEHTDLLRREKELAGDKTDNPEELEKIVTNQVEDDCELHALSYCDLMERIAFLTIIDKIDVRITIKFDEYFEYVQLMMHWYDDVVVKKQENRKLRPSKERWSSILDWCTKKNVDKKAIEKAIKKSNVDEKAIKEAIKKANAPIIADVNPQYLPELMISYWKHENESSYNTAKNATKKAKSDKSA